MVSALLKLIQRRHTKVSRKPYIVQDRTRPYNTIYKVQIFIGLARETPLF